MVLKEDLSNIRGQLETLHGVVERLSSNGTSSANPIPSPIGAGLPALADSRLELSGPPATSARLGLTAKTTDAIKKGEFVDFDLFLSECFIVWWLQMRENISSPSRTLIW